jgi:lipid A 3-O-deacylase
LGHSCNFHRGLAAFLILWGGLWGAKPASGSDGELGKEKEFIAEDMLDIQLASGPLFSSQIFGNRTPTTNAWQSNLRLGWILNKPAAKPSLLRGNFEAILDLSYALINQGPGNYWAGIAALIRYNFIPPNSRWIPYVQVGAGIVNTDAYKDESQDAIGEAIEFTPQASLGIRYFFKENWSLNIEGGFLHISNANLADRNTGLNFFGGFIGISYLFDPWGRTK